MIKGTGSGADALILDLEDSVAVDRLSVARTMVLSFLRTHAQPRNQKLWVRINPLGSGKELDDLATVVAGAPDGVLVPKCDSPEDIRTVDHYLTVLERRENVAAGSIGIIPVATETATSLFALGQYLDVSTRLLGLTWGAEDLATALGASTNKADDGVTLSFTFQMARSLCLLGAKSAKLYAIDSVNPDFRDSKALDLEVQRARKDGFTSKMAIHPDQVAVINEGFMPSQAEIERAQAIIQAFQNSTGVGAVQIDGIMLDKPHLQQAMNLLAAAGISP
jgi:citrate lyase subunit beta/citryl-CoA lyase